MATFIVDPGMASEETLKELVEAISELNRATGGEELEFSYLPVKDKVLLNIKCDFEIVFS